MSTIHVFLSGNESAQSIRHLFVFDSPSDVIAFRDVLQDHHEAHGTMADRAGVFLCSMSSYKKLLKGFDTHCEALKTFDVGHIDLISGVARWSPRWAESGEALAYALQALFRDRPAPVIHLVLLNPKVDGPAVAQHLHQLAARFQLQRSVLRFQRVAVTRRRDMAAVDGRYAAPLQLDGGFAYALVMEFEDTESLRHYYQHELHSLEREELYVLLNPAVRSHFDEVSRIDRTQIDTRARMFAEIERQMVEGGFVRRFDLHNDEPLASLVRRVVSTVSPRPHASPQ